MIKERLKMFISLHVRSFITGTKKSIALQSTHFETMRRYTPHTEAILKSLEPKSRRSMPTCLSPSQFAARVKALERIVPAATVQPDERPGKFVI
jgi:hypothetical protein